MNVFEIVEIKMEEDAIYFDGLPETVTSAGKTEEDEEDFRSCCENEDELKDREESIMLGTEAVELDELSAKMYFKGVSVSGPGESDFRLSGLGVVIDKCSDNAAPIQVQKSLDFSVEESVVNYLALMEGLIEAKECRIKRVFAFTDSEILFDQIMQGQKVEDPLLMELKERILEHANSLEAFTLTVVPTRALQMAVELAQVAIGLISFPPEVGQSTENCSICCDEKLASMMTTMKCSHRFCSHCMKTYVECKVQSNQVPCRCPQLGCKHYLSASECKLFLPITSYNALEKALLEANAVKSDKIYCPYPSCSVLLDPLECLSSMESSSTQSEYSHVVCPVCRRFICLDCGVPWHSSLTCEEYQNLPLEERDASDITLHHLAHSKGWRRCRQCRRMIELTHGCYHMTCWCGNEFCYSCGADYRDGQQTCQCAFWDENYSEDGATHPTEEYEQWHWDSFDTFPLTMDAHSDEERAQLVLMQRFLTGSFSLTNHQSPLLSTDSYADAMKDIGQLPWLERFVSVISDNYHDNYI